jgi:hypothetical protein
MGQGLSGSSKQIIASTGNSREQSRIQADPVFGPYEIESLWIILSAALLQRTASAAGLVF